MNQNQILYFQPNLTSVYQGAMTNHGMKHEAAMECMLEILQNNSDKDHQMSVRQISMKSNGLLSEKQIRACLKEYMEIQSGPHSALFRYHNKGTVRENGRERDNRYYWEPFLTDGEREVLKKIS